MFFNRVFFFVINIIVGILRDVIRGRKYVIIKVKSDKRVILNLKIEKSVDIVYKKEFINEIVISIKENREYNDMQLKILDSFVNKIIIIKDVNIIIIKGFFFDDRKNNLVLNDFKYFSNFLVIIKRGIRIKQQIKN